MATLTIRQLDEQTHVRLRRKAAENGRSVEAEVRAILAAAVNTPQSNFLVALHEAIAVEGGVSLELDARTDMPRTVDLA